ncbi:hypothetical protein BTH42_07560 [Burkholderia sp. SRS-W-2-2016]|uniref:hypothetical protein n=1 Tax=Burkholderia sp. SRS-W-2-2016 TaxID=1926878 RepID=UPI00094B0B57|nr:hypothetical protein [Burkholderia sp. SRS-W-2-2016]OLL32294.1 hypothetical protein BTH42_07560 [Burkholderia sp. SRS-W-2-2016]
MTNTGKLLIVGLLVIDAGIAGYLLFPKDDERTPSAASEVIGRITGATDSDAERGAARVAGGNVMAVTPVPSAPPATATVTVPAQPAPSTTNQLAVTPQSAQPQAAATLPQTGALAQPSVAATAAVPGLAVPDAGQAAAARARQPAQPVAQQRAQAKALPGPRIDQAQTRRRDDTHPNGSNPVAAMLTDQLVKESAKPDPSLPMPTGVTVPLSQERTTPPSVGSAMTDQLVRESSRVTPMTQPAQPPILKPQ